MDKERLDRFEAKIDKISDKISSIDATLAAQHVSLSEHIRRTMLLEKAVVPLVKQDFRMQGVIKFFLFLAAIGAGVEGFIWALKHL